VSRPSKGGLLIRRWEKIKETRVLRGCFRPLLRGGVSHSEKPLLTETYYTFSLGLPRVQKKYVVHLSKEENERFKGALRYRELMSVDKQPL
jgi:hypothetical protein